MTGAFASLGRRRIRPGAAASKPRPIAEQDVDREVDPEDLQRRQRDAVRDVEDAGAQEEEDEPAQRDHLEADVLHQVVVDRPAALDRGDDGGEVVVGEDHVPGFLRHLGAGDAHRDPDVGALERGSVVDAVAGHRDDVALLLERLDEPHLVLGRDARDDADVLDLRVELRVAQRRELGARERACLRCRAGPRSRPRS